MAYTPPGQVRCFFLFRQGAERFFIENQPIYSKKLAPLHFFERGATFTEIGSWNWNKESQFIRIEIADDGPGISDEDKQKLFTPYFSNKSSGTGLGLAIAHNIIDEHNGIISIEDNTSRGARFIIEIPA